MPIYVLLVACNKLLRDTAANLAGQSMHKVVAVPDLETALNALSGIRFDVLVTGDMPFDGVFERFLGAARKLQPALRVVDSRKVPEAPATLRLAGLRSVFTRPPVRPYAYVRKSADALPTALLS